MAKRETKRYLDGVPVQDARSELYVVIKPADLRAAVRGDITHCVFTRACRRLYGASRVYFLRTTAYVELPDAKGKKKILRYVLPKEARKVVEDFDLRKPIQPNTGFVLKAPTGKHRLDYMKPCHQDDRMKTYQKKHRSKKLILGEAVRGEKASQEKGLEIRNGTGLVQFIQTKKRKA